MGGTRAQAARGTGAAQGRRHQRRGSLRRLRRVYPGAFYFFFTRRDEERVGVVGGHAHLCFLVRPFVVVAQELEEESLDASELFRQRQQQSEQFRATFTDLFDVWDDVTDFDLDARVEELTQE